MITLNPILSDATPDFVLAWQLYEEAFPEKERRSLTQQLALLENPLYSFCSIQQQERFVGLIGLWQLPGYTFLEHFAVLGKERGKGLGQEALLALLSWAGQLVVLEVEPPQTEIANKRVSFYKRAGFHLCPFSYQQPPYAKEKPWVPLHLMSFPQPLAQKIFEATVKQLYTEVYQVPFGK